MATIDKLDISVYNMYAIRTRMIEQFDKQMHLEAASSIPPQTQVLNTQAQLTEIDLLLGVGPMVNPWAYFFPPKQFGAKRKSPFTFSRVIPSLKATDESSDEFIALQEVNCKSPEEENEKAVLTSCFKEINKLNSWLSFIIGRVGQFLQG
jgi:hypothetical protein